MTARSFPIPTVIVLTMSLLLGACAAPRYIPVDHRVFQKTPDPPSSRFWRMIAKSTPWTAQAAFHGNWGGPGNSGGRPVDRMDEGFRRHDIVYHESRRGAHLKAADRALAA